MENIKLFNGNESAAEAAMLCQPDVISAYPITPQTQIVEILAKFAAEGKIKTQFVNVESEHSALALLMGSAISGARTFTATSSQGLTLMHENLHWASRSSLPIVLVNVNRALGSPWNIWADMDDSLSQRDTGWFQIYSENSQEVLDNVIQAFKIAESLYVPVMVCLEGFLLSHTGEKVEIPNQILVDKFLPKLKMPWQINLKRRRTYGSSSSPDIYFQMRKNKSEFLKNSPLIIQEIGREFQEKFGRNYGLIEHVKTEGSEIAVVSMGSITSVCRYLLREEIGRPFDLVKIRVFRPLPEEKLRESLSGFEKIIVLDNDTQGVLFQEVKSALYWLSQKPDIFNFIIGVGGATVNPPLIKKIIDKVGKSKKTSRKSVWQAAYKKKVETSFDPIKSITKNLRDFSRKDDLLVSGGRNCQGCGATLVMKYLLEVLGKDTVIAMPACCYSIIAGPYPYTDLKVNLIHCPFETAAVSATGIKRALTQKETKATVVAFAGDGGTFDIGLGALSSAAERNEDIIYICYDNEAYMNTGRQRSSATPFGAETETTPSPAFKPEFKKDIMGIMAAHRIPYIATASIAYPKDYKNKLEKAEKIKGFRFFHVLTPCPPGWKFESDLSIKLARLAVQTKVFPLYEVENGIYRVKEPDIVKPVDEYLKLQNRFSHLTPEIIKIIQEKINKEWERLNKTAEIKLGW